MQWKMGESQSERERVRKGEQKQSSKLIKPASRLLLPLLNICLDVHNLEPNGTKSEMFAIRPGKNWQMNRSRKRGIAWNVKGLEKLRENEAAPDDCTAHMN